MTTATRTRPQRDFMGTLGLVAGWTEAQLAVYVRNTARGLGWKRYHTRFSIGSDAGFPDELLCRPPRVIVAELKRETGRMTEGRLVPGRWPRWVEGQKEWLAVLLACPGVETYLWRPSHWQEIATILQTGPDADMACIAELAKELAPE